MVLPRFNGYLIKDYSNKSGNILSMSSRLLKIYTLLLVCLMLQSCSQSLDDDLGEIISKYGITPLDSQPFEKTDRYLLGQALFFDPILSGNRDVSCATCHLFRRGTSDKLPTSIGVNGKGLGEERKLLRGELEHPRNSLDLWNRDNQTVKNLFWDGEVEVLDPKNRIFRSPMEDKLPRGMENALAIQALVPLVSTDEMLGRAGDRSRTDLPGQHANLPNEFANYTKELDGLKRITAVHKLIIKRLIGENEENLTQWQKEYRRLFTSAFRDRSASDMKISDVGNIIAHFEEVAFATRNAAWDKYVRGDTSAISDKSKRGVILFYGKARCAQCHNGQIFSDFNFHALGVNQEGPGIDKTGKDLGRFRITNNENDKYKFRTPPLRNVSLTGPYFHTGKEKDLRKAVEFHFVSANKRNGVTVSSSLPKKLVINDAEISEIIAFLLTLEDDQQHNIKNIIPRKVPSGLPIASAPNSQK